MQAKSFLMLVIFAIFVTLAQGCTKTVDDEPADLVTYSIEEVALHDSSDDCWIVIDGKVYDATTYLPQHTKRVNLALDCGTDASIGFETRPEGSGTPHSERARDILAELYIGELA